MTKKNSTCNNYSTITIDRKKRNEKFNIVFGKTNKVETMNDTEYIFVLSLKSIEALAFFFIIFVIHVFGFGFFFTASKIQCYFLFSVFIGELVYLFV